MSRSATDADAFRAIQLIGDTATTIAGAARTIGCDRSSLNKLLRTDAYADLALVADREAAEQHIELAIQALRDIPDDAERGCIARQIAMEQQHRKLASFRNRKYGDRVEHDISNVGAITIKVLHFAAQEEPLTIDCSNSEQAQPVDNLLDIKLPTE